VSTFLSAGYYLTRRCPRPAWAHGDRSLLPATIVTLSPCLIDVVPSLWPSPTVPRLSNDAELARLGITPAAAVAAEAWATERCDAVPHEWPLPFATLADLRTFVDRFVVADADVLLVGAALTDDLVAGFVASASASGGGCERSHALRRALPPDPAGERVGFEVLGDGVHEHHSIVCTGGEVDLHDRLGIAMNANGLIDDLDDARRAAAWASEDGHGEPVAYLPWRTALYSRSRAG
jgi:hypothetical protein